MNDLDLARYALSGIDAKLHTLSQDRATLMKQIEELEKQPRASTQPGDAIIDNTRKRRGRPPGSKNNKPLKASVAPPAPKRKKHRISPEGKARIAAAAKARWVAVRAGKAATK